MRLEENWVFEVERMQEKKEEKQQLVCPECGGTDMRWFLGGKMGDMYRCHKCNYHGIGLRGNAKFIEGLREKKKTGN